MSAYVGLDKINTNIKVKIKSIEISGQDNILQRLKELGFTKGTIIEIQHKSLDENMLAVKVRGSVIGIRDEVAKCISIQHF